jgi:phosphoglycerol transferase MdoB-like AlkP superfamily enzyme
MAFGLCKYRDLFGVPNTGVHKYRLFGFAILDAAVVVIFGIIIANWMKTPLWLTLAILFILGIVIHRLFCVRTAVDRMLFPNATKMG